MIRRSTLIAALAALTLAAGCGDDTPAPAAAPPPVKKAAPAVDAAAAAAASGPTYIYAYNPVGKRDPFRSPDIGRQPGMAGADTVNPCNEPLCFFDLDQLTLVAVVTGDANPFAMVEDPEGRGFIVRRNSRMGRQGGKVSNILRDSLVVTEYFNKPDGTKVPNAVSLKLKADKTFTPAMDFMTNQMEQ